MIEEKKVVYYVHDCKEMGCRVLKVNKEPCQFCGTMEWRKTIEIVKKHVFPVEEESDT